ncbi:phage tail terminator-like protein [Paracraurococcus lichenis]|uniref:Phage tail terminator-like protein n=1 Tax=Paracraurococcus lichenis TaxID=3064888 RepID=A0ABT9E8M4_9PROT|nr:phage tail terminator-like protein [Paracraurococcus sp. LOR1-02]MDO9712454.1 phage tail terminator-like protein [Paracraurococcus sp. LOR1-02]
MSSATAFAAIHDYLTAGWSNTPLVFENEIFDLPAVPTPWVMVEVYGDSDEQISLGAGSAAANRWREEGAVLCHVMVPQGTGTLTARIHAEGLADLLRGVELAGDVKFRRMSIGAGTAGTEDGTYWVVTLRAEWTRG